MGTSTAIGVGGLRKRRRKAMIARTVARSKLSRDRSRARLLHARERYKLRVWKHERGMDARKAEQPSKLGPLAISLMPPRESAKRSRAAQARWTAIPSRPKYSSVAPKERLYGWRFEARERRLKERKPEEKKPE